MLLFHGQTAGHHFFKCLPGGKEDSEGAPFPGLAAGFDAAVVGFDQLPADRQPQADALDLGGEKGFKELSHVFRQDARAGILYTYFHKFSLQAGSQGQGSDPGFPGLAFCPAADSETMAWQALVSRFPKTCTTWLGSTMTIGSSV